MRLKVTSFQSNLSFVTQLSKRILKMSFSVLGMFLLWFVSGQAISFAQDPYPSDSDAIRWHQINITKDDVLNKAINSIDFGEYKTETSSIKPNVNAQGGGLDYRSQSNGTFISLSPQYNERSGFSFGGILATPVSKNTALGILLNVGSDRNEWLVNAGWDIDDHQLVIGTLGQLRQNQDFSFISGVEKAQITQNNAALSYQYLLGRTLVNSAEINAYISDTRSLKLSDKTFYTDNASLYELWNDPRRIAGGRVEGFQGRMVFTPSSQSILKLGLGAERLSYDLLVGKENYLRATGSTELNQQLSHGFNLTVAANLAASQDKYAVGLSKSFNDGYQLGANVAAIRGRDGTFDDNQLTINFTHSLGATKPSAQALYSQALKTQDSSVKAVATDPASKVNVDGLSDKPKAQWTSSLVNAVAKRPLFLPSQVNAKVDTTATPTRLIAIDKTQIPTGSTIDKANGVLTVPIQVSGVDVAVSAIDNVNITKNSGIFTNSGQFALSGSTYLVINPNLIEQPATTDTYIVPLINSIGGGTTLATITVSHGSTKIDSVIISAGTIITVLNNFVPYNSSFLSDTSCSSNCNPQTFSPSSSKQLRAPETNSPGNFSYSTSNSLVATVNNASGLMTIIGIGSTIVTATQAADGNYTSASQSAKFTVTSATPALAGLGLSSSSVVFGASAPTVTAPTSASSGAITYTSSDTSVATISGSTITVVGVGSTTITATQAAAGNYTSTTATTSLTVTASTVASLSGLALSSGTINPTFVSGTISYSASVSNATSSVTVTPIVTDSNSTVKVNGVSVFSGVASGAISLNVGANTITTVVTAQDGTTIKTYTVSLTRAADAVNVNYLIVAGGGGGGRGTGGGGGAGGVLSGNISLSKGTLYIITVGSGGLGGAEPVSSQGSNGGDSSISSLDLTALGGGGGGSNRTTNGAARSGGSGGGGSDPRGLNQGAPGAGTPGQGNAGGKQTVGWDGSYGCGGGGGAGGVGTNSDLTMPGGAGGIGIINPISGSTIGQLSGGNYYVAGGGGGGSLTSNNSLGGLGGGGTTSTSGMTNTGGGGGGSKGNGTNEGNGGSGVVIISVPTASYAAATATGSYTTTTSGANTIITFTANGSYTP